MKRSEIKTIDYTSVEYFKVSVVKISARSDKVKGGGALVTIRRFGEKPVFEKNTKFF